MNILLFASDKKYVNYIKNVHNELVERNHNSFFFYTESELTNVDISKYSYDYKEEVDLSKGILSKSLFGIHLPFVPDVIFLARERWQPEQNIIKEFKETFNTKVALMEVNTALLQNYEVIFEYYSRNQYPQNMIDVYFEHCEFSLQGRIEFSFENSYKSVIVGNPKYDDIMKYKPTEESINYFNKKYNLNPDKKNILWYSCQTLGRNKCLDALRELSEKYSDEYNILYKSFPNEPYELKYSSDFIKVGNEIKSSIPNVKLIHEDTDLFYMSHMCDIHIGIIGSVMYFPLILNKKIVNINNLTNHEVKGTEIDTLFEENEDIASGETGRACDFWVRVFGLKSIDELLEIIGNRLDKFKVNNKKLREIYNRNTLDWDDGFSFLNRKPPDNTELLNLFDDFNDFNASKRIVDELEKYDRFL